MIAKIEYGVYKNGCTLRIQSSDNSAPLSSDQSVPVGMWGGPPGTGCLWEEKWAGVSRLSFAPGFDRVLGGFVSVLVSIVSGPRWFRVFSCLVLRWIFLKLRRFRVFAPLVSRFAMGLVAGSAASHCSSAPYIDHSFKFTVF